MSFLLKHHFNPDWDPAKLTPEEQTDGSVDHTKLNFVQNFSAGDVIAEWVEPDGAEAIDSRFLYDAKEFPAGKGTGIRKKHPDKLFAARDGYACYLDGRIVVRNTLTIHQDVNYHTGDVYFIGDMVVEGSVRSGFEIVGRSVSVHDQVEAAHVKAKKEMRCRGGVKGGGEAFLESARDMKLAFCENATLKSRHCVKVQGALMHSDVFADEGLAVGGRLTGGETHAYRYVFVGEQLGGGLDTVTSVFLGYQPSLLFKDAQHNRRIKRLHEDIAAYEKALNKKDEYRGELLSLMESAVKELELLKTLKVKLWDGIHAAEQLDRCRVVVPGVVKPGVEISIGSAYLKVDDFLEDVYFFHENDEVKIGVNTGTHRR
ncbi:MAG: DUF342 domain-containing protein [Desulfovibrionaceae bacterium]|nr:DUF342 domain-containing protein [Desulfovibrionaceae bacterium]